MGWPATLISAGVVSCTLIGYLFNIVYNHRRRINELRKQGVPMPEGWSWMMGHLLVLQKYLAKIPPDAAVGFAMRDMSQEHADTEIFLLDVWPVYPALFVICGPESADKVCAKYNLPKSAVSASSMQPVTGGNSLISMNGDEWKYWRSLFNPGFSSGAMLNLVPHLVDSALVFREKLAEKVGKGMFSLDEFTSKLTMEVILKVTLDESSNYQRESHIIPTALGRILNWHSFWDPRILLHPLRPLVQWYNGYVLDNYIRGVLQKRYSEIKIANSFSGSKPAAPKSVITLALEAYLDDHGKRDLDETFAKYAASQIRLFLFAGNDTTASTLVYVYHMLAKHPDWLAKVRREHDEVFGPDPSLAAGLLRSNPSLLNRCRLTLAVAKETLRLYAPAGTTRAGVPGAAVTDRQGRERPLDYVGVNVLHQAVHANPRVWPRPAEFRPERFLVGPGHALHPADPAAYRPFEQGPRGCIGQTLVWNELRVAVVLTCRDLEIRDAYADFDAEREKTNNRTWKHRLSRRVWGEPVRTLHGDRAYQTDSGGLHPVDGYPCYVDWVTKKEKS